MPKNNTGFTLIELLVVVLIIGILAAVALPQYQQAVKKAKYTQALTMCRSFANAEETYYLANGSYTQDIHALDIDLAASRPVPGSGWYEFNGNYVIGLYTDGVLCGHNTVGGVADLARVWIMYNHVPDRTGTCAYQAGKAYCYADDKFCKSLGGNLLCTSSAAYEIP